MNIKESPLEHPTEIFVIAPVLIVLIILGMGALIGLVL